MKIDGSVALVTGADRGLGQVFARDLVTGVRPESTQPRVIRPPSPSPA